MFADSQHQTPSPEAFDCVGMMTGAPATKRARTYPVLKDVDVESWRLVESKSPDGKTNLNIEGENRSNFVNMFRPGLKAAHMPFGFELQSKFKEIDVESDKSVGLAFDLYPEQVDFLWRIDKWAEAHVKPYAGKNAVYYSLVKQDKMDVRNLRMKVDVSLGGSNPTSITFVDDSVEPRAKAIDGSGNKFLKDVLGKSKGVHWRCAVRLWLCGAYADESKYGVKARCTQLFLIKTPSPDGYTADEIDGLI